MKLSRLLTVAALAFTLSGCATLFGDKNRTVLVTSTPSGAKVYFQGAYIGNTPVPITVNNPLDATTVSIRQDGYYESTTPVKTEVQYSTFLNFFFWPGFIVDAITGNIKRVDPNLSVYLTPNQNAVATPAVETKK
jgi:hypothetical protein